MKYELTLNDLRTMYQNDLSSFIQWSFNQLYPNVDYYHNWHIDVMADKLMQCYRGDIKRLIINVPPRSLKSVCTSVAFPAWVLANNPSLRVLCTSYGDELVKDFGIETRKLMNTPMYQRLFPRSRLTSRTQAINKLSLIDGGCRLGVSSSGALTGRGGDIIIIDDPLKASDANTKERDNINQWFDDNVYQRLNNKNEGVIIVVMQRLHMDDLTAHLLAQSDDWHVCELKAIAEEDENHVLSHHSGSAAYTRPMGEALNPQLESLEQLKKAKKTFGSYIFNSQYQQSPSSDKEALIRADWFPRYEKNWANIASTEHIYRDQYGINNIVQSWDTAMTDGDKSDYSVCITFAVIDENVYIIDVYREKLRFKPLIDAITLKNKQFRPNTILIEDSPAGHHIIEAMRSDYHLSIKAIKPIGDKHTRMSAVSGLIESERVYLPEQASWLDDFLLEITRFPNVKHDDQVDAFSQGLNEMNDILNPKFEWSAGMLLL